MTEEEIAAQKAEEDRVKAEADAKAKAEADAKAAEEKRKSDEEAEARRKATQSSNLTEEQWVALEKGYGMPRQQLLANWAMIQNAQASHPANKLLEKDAWAEATKGVKDISFFEGDAKKAVESLTPAERQDPKRVREKIMAVRGEKIQAAGGDGETRRFSSGLDGGASEGGGGGGKGAEMPEFAGADIDKRDQAEVFKRYGFKDKAEWQEHQKKAISVDESNFVPKFGR